MKGIKKDALNANTLCKRFRRFKNLDIDAMKCTNEELRQNIESIMFYLEGQDRKILNKVWLWDGTWQGFKESDEETTGRTQISLL